MPRKFRRIQVISKAVVAADYLRLHKKELQILWTASAIGLGVVRVVENIDGGIVDEAQLSIFEEPQV